MLCRRDGARVIPLVVRHAEGRERKFKPFEQGVGVQRVRVGSQLLSNVA
jgi:hypothetical protein